MPFYIVLFVICYIRLSDGDVLMLENARFHKEEEKNVPEFAEKLAKSASATVYVNDAARLFTGTATGTSADNPTDPTSLSNDQASRGVQFFFRPDDGVVDATFSVTYSGAGSCTGRSLLFAGDSALCAPPPPQRAEASYPRRRVRCCRRPSRAASAPSVRRREGSRWAAA